MILSFNIVAKPAKRRITFKEDYVMTWWNLGAGLGLAGGLLAGITGFLLTGMSWLLGNELAASSVGKTATWLIIAMIPLMALGAHCLDKIDQVKRAERIEFGRRHGLLNMKWR